MTTLELAPQELVIRALPLTVGIEEVGGANRGRAVERMLKLVGLGPGAPWCAAFVSLVGRFLFPGTWKLPFTASCDVLLEHARKHGILRDTPAMGAVFLLLKSKHDAIHTGFCTSDEPTDWDATEGNTNPKGGRDGYGVFERQRGGPEDQAVKAGMTYAFIYWWEL